MLLDRFLLRLAHGAIARPRLAIAVPAFIVALAVPGLFRLELRTDGHALVPPGAPAVHFDAAVRERFGLRDPIAIYIESPHPDGIYNPATLRRVAEISAALMELPEVEPRHVTSLATERRDKVYPGSLDFRPFLDPFPDTPELLNAVRDDVAATAILTGTLVSEDEQATAILVGVPNLPPDRAPHQAVRIELYRQVLEIVEPHRGDGRDGEDRIEVVGAPVAEFLLGVHILEDLRLLVPLAMLVIAAVLGLACRRFWGVMLGLAEVGACLLFTFGVMGLVGVPVYLPTAVLPVILTTLGLADEIHLFWHYQRLLRQADGDASRRDLVRRTLDEMTRPIALTSLTTTLGFLSFLASPIVPVRAFGAFAAVGILFCLLWSLSVIPAALALLPAAKMRPPERAAGSVFVERAFTAVERRPRAVLLAIAVLTLALGAGTTRLYVQDSWIDGFAPQSPFREATTRVNEKLFGSHLLLVELDLGEEMPADAESPRVSQRMGLVGPLLSPSRLAAIDAFEEFLRRRPEVGGVLGPASQVRTVRYLWLARRQDGRQLPIEPARIQLVLRRFEQARGVERRREVIDDEARRGVVTIFLEDANYRETAALMAAIRHYERQRLAPLGISAGFAGDVAVSQAMIPAIVETQVASLLLALLGAFLAVAMLTRSLQRALLAVAPAAAAVAWTFGVMGFVGMPLGVATSMFCAVTLGIGVDYAVHFTERFEIARRRGMADAARHACTTAGPAILADTAAIALGFGLLGFSSVPANARLGFLVAFALVAGCFLTLGGLGAWLALRSQGENAE